MTSALSFKNTSEFLKFVETEDVRFVDFNFTDLNGVLHHVTFDAGSVDKVTIEKGVFFDGSSISGWKDIHHSDMSIKPDINCAVFDPFSAQKTLKLMCDVYDPSEGRPYDLDPRFVARAAEEHVKASGIADAFYVGPEPEFFIFDDVRYNINPYRTVYEVNGHETPHNSANVISTGNLGHRPRAKGGYFPESPVDSLSDIRGEMLSVLQSMGVSVDKHHHEVAPNQCEIGIKFNTLLKSADNLQLFKYAVKNVANSYGRTATFMPKPIAGDNGSGMHCHQSLWLKGKPLFAGKSYAGLSDTALYYIGGIIRHARVLNAFTNPSTNSYKRLVPGYEAPVLLAYSAHNRSAACRIPAVNDPNHARLEVRFPDPSANPYLAFAAMLMAGLDGIKNKIHPGEAAEKNLYTLSDAEYASIPKVSHSLRASIEALESSHAFLLDGGVFTMELIKSYIALKKEQLALVEGTVHPAEYYLYYSC